MPYYLCPVCALRAHSAASESCCPACEAPLRRSNQLHPSGPQAESLGGWRTRPEPVTLFRGVSRASLR